LVLAGIVLLAWTQPWFTLALVERRPLDVPGQSAAPALSALGLASLALVGALSIASRTIRPVLGTVQATIGILIAATAVTAASDPVSASASTVTDATGLSGAHSVAALVDSVATTAWPYVAVGAGALLCLVGIAVVLTSPRWPATTRKYDTTDAQGPWDALSSGADPTDR
jgi:hypothetical protein